MAYGLTRADQMAEHAYVNPDGDAFFTPDGEGRYYFDNLADLLEEHDPIGITYLGQPAEDW